VIFPQSIEAYVSEQRLHNGKEYTAQGHLHVDDASQQKALSADDATNAQAAQMRRRTRAPAAEQAAAFRGGSPGAATRWKNGVKNGYTAVHEGDLSPDSGKENRRRGKRSSVTSGDTRDGAGAGKQSSAAARRSNGSNGAKARGKGNHTTSTSSGDANEGLSIQHPSECEQLGSGKGAADTVMPAPDTPNPMVYELERDSDPTTGMPRQVRPWAVPVDEKEAAEVDQCLDNVCLRLARTQPVLYLRIISYLLVMTELVAMMTPCVAMGIQWITALCDGPPLMAIIELLWETFVCLRTWGLECQLHKEDFNHCILK
jgi:hypothetical protein